MNPEIKSVFASKTMWGLLVAALPTVLGFFKFQISDVAAFTAGAEQLINDAVLLAGLLGAAYGRFKATSALVIKK